MRRLAAVTLAALCSGCLPTKSVRESPAARESFTSSKPAEQLAGCIADAWEAAGQSGIKTNRTAHGWSVIIELDMNTYGIADVSGDGKPTTVVYSTPMSGMARDHVPAIRSCL